MTSCQTVILAGISLVASRGRGGLAAVTRVEDGGRVGGCGAAGHRAVPPHVHHNAKEPEHRRKREQCTKGIKVSEISTVTFLLGGGGL